MSEKHTQGPWKVAPDFSIVSEHAYYKIAEIVAGDREGECEANASLIAASPDLLKAAQDVLSHKRGEDDWLILSIHCRALEDAVKKATGEQP